MTVLLSNTLLSFYMQMMRNPELEEEEIERLEDEAKYWRTSRQMSLVVLAFLAQWWPIVPYSIWFHASDEPHIAIVEVM